MESCCTRTNSFSESSSALYSSFPSLHKYFPDNGTKSERKVYENPTYADEQPQVTLKAGEAGEEADV